MLQDQLALASLRATWTNVAKNQNFARRFFQKYVKIHYAILWLSSGIAVSSLARQINTYLTQELSDKAR